ncbi:MAG: hypothetical protein AB1422_11940 [bacterium]
MRKDTKMAVGLPGSGISGLFYLLSALLMPVHELLLLLRRRSNRNRWHFVLRQTIIALLVIGGIWITLQAFAIMLSAKALPNYYGNSPSAIKFGTVFISLAILGIIILGMQIMDIISKLRTICSCKISTFLIKLKFRKRSPVEAE